MHPYDMGWVGKNEVGKHISKGIRKIETKPIEWRQCAEDKAARQLLISNARSGTASA